MYMYSSNEYIYIIVSTMPEPVSADYVNKSLEDQRNALKTRYENIKATINSLTPLQTTQKTSLEKHYSELVNEKYELEKELAELKSREQKINKEFQDRVYYNDAPTTDKITTLQDFAIAFFAIGWFLLGAVIVSISTFQADGTIKKGMVVSALYAIITIIIYSLFNMYL